ncbi:MAG TPA: pitrilysin family protein [Rhodothermales bacterium]|nr:pitrilysin family protein [Rhodothermales bacterium]
MTQKTVLANGIRVVTETIPTVRTVSVGVWVDSGSRDEVQGEEGMTHFIEHMVFKGTQKRKMKQIAAHLESVGGYLNAFTGKENTCYYARALVEHAERAIDLLTDLVFFPVFPASELDKEKEVVVEEMKMYEDDPEESIFDQFERAVYGDQPMGNPIIGFPETVMAFTQSQLLAFVENRYQSQRVVVAVAGAISHEKVVRLVEKYTAGVKQSEASFPERIWYAEAAQRKEKPKPIQQAHLILGTTCAGLRDESRRNVLSVLNTMLSGGMSSRLNLNIREKYGYCYSIYSSLNVFSDVGDFSVYMGTDPTKIDRARNLIHRELARFVEEPIPIRLMAQAKKQIKAGLMYELEGTTNCMMRIGRMELYFGRFYSPEEISEAVDAVQAEEVKQAAQELFIPEKFAEVVYLPTMNQE